MIKCIVRLDDDDLDENEIGCYLWHRNTDNCSAPATDPGHLSVLSRLSRDMWQLGPGPSSPVTQCSNLVNIGICATLSHIINRTQTLACLLCTSPLINNIGCSKARCVITNAQYYYYSVSSRVLTQETVSLNSGHCWCTQSLWPSGHHILHRSFLRWSSSQCKW